MCFCAQTDNYGPHACPGEPATSANAPAPAVTTSSASGSSSIGAGAIVGIVVGVLAAIVVAAALLWLFVGWRRRRSKSRRPLVTQRRDYSLGAKVRTT